MQTIRIGLLFSLTGTTSITEEGQYQAALYALETYNSEKDDNDPSFEVIVRDTQSDPDVCMKQVAELAEAGVKFFVGCSTSACRKAVVPMIEQYGCLLFFPLMYEGNESHPNVFYTGEVPNQQVVTLLQYAFNHYGPRVYLIGTDYIYPRSTNQLVHQYAPSQQGKVVGEQYVSFGHSLFLNSFREMIAAKPDFILSTLVGESVIHFYRAFYEMGLAPEQLPIFTPIITETVAQAIGPAYVAGHYSGGSYFQSIPSPQNRAFVQGFQQMYGSEKVICSYMVNAYIAVEILLTTIARIRKTSPLDVAQTLQGQTFQTPGGLAVLGNHNHLSRYVRIGRANADGQFSIVWESDQAIPAKPFSTYDSVPFGSSGSDWKLVLEKWGKETREAVFVVSKDGRIEYANDNAFHLLDKQIGDRLNPEALNELSKRFSIRNTQLSEDYLFCLINGQNHAVEKREQTQLLHSFHNINTRSPLYRNELYEAKIAASSDANVLILGETGTGKEVLAQAIHQQSTRRNGPFIAVNVGAISRDLIASELFGYVEGAFTGSKRGGAIGKFEAAHQGTLFLDELGEMPLELQVTLLRVLSERKVVRIGDHKERPIDVRIIAATNRNLTEEIAYRGSFRSDLYYRLNVFSITIPPLRQRIEDVEHLSLEFLEQLRAVYRKGPNEISPSAVRALESYSWPGNVRELRNVIERAYHLAFEQKEISNDHLPKEFRGPRSILDKATSLEDMEKNMIEQALYQMPTISAAARELGISRGTLYRKMNQWGMKKR